MDFLGESELYNIYDYDSNYEHSLWGAIRECSLMKCENPGHMYHCVPDVDDVQKCTNVCEDCCFIMDKTINILKEEFGYKIQGNDE